MNELVERIAQAIHDPWDRGTLHDMDNCRRIAREALTAIREPTDGMKRQADSNWSGFARADVRSAADRLWKAMIDEELK